MDKDETDKILKCEKFLYFVRFFKYFYFKKNVIIVGLSNICYTDAR